MNDLYLAHHGVKGMKWGVRRYQNYDGTWKTAGKRHAKEIGGYYKSVGKTAAKGVSSVAKNVADVVTGKDTVKKAFNDVKRDLSRNSSAHTKYVNSMSKGSRAVTQIANTAAMFVPVGGIVGTTGAAAKGAAATAKLGKSAAATAFKTGDKVLANTLVGLGKASRTASNVAQRNYLRGMTAKAAAKSGAETAALKGMYAKDAIKSAAETAKLRSTFKVAKAQVVGAQTARNASGAARNIGSNVVSRTTSKANSLATRAGMTTRSIPTSARKTAETVSAKAKSAKLRASMQTRAATTNTNNANTYTRYGYGKRQKYAR